MSTRLPADPTVLIVDDEASILEALRKVLTKEGLNVVTAKNGREALDVVRTRPIHVMITDLRMPTMGGDDLLKAVKAGQVEGISFEEQLADAVASELLSREDADKLRTVKEMVSEIIAVDDFDGETLRLGAEVREEPRQSNAA